MEISSYLIVNSPDRARAIAAAQVTKLAPKLHELDLVTEIVRNYLERIPILQIARRIKKEKATKFKDDSIAIIAGAIRLCVSRNVLERERKIIEFYHRSVHGRNVHDNKQGFFALGNDERLANATKGGSVSGTNAARTRTGLFALGKAEKRANASMGGRASHLAMGHTLWIMKPNEATCGLGELDYCIYLATLPKYTHQSGRNKERVDGQKIADKLNRVFHGGQAIRTARQITIRLTKKRASARKNG